MEGQDSRTPSSSPTERPQLDPRNLIPIPTLTADGTGTILWLNHAAEELIGRPQQDVVGGSFRDLLSPRLRRRFVRDIWRWQKGEEPELSLELPLRGPQNVARWAGLRVRRVAFRPGKLVFVASFYDLDGVYAERERLQRQVQELEARVREATAAAELKSDFLRVAGEQIRTPMSGLIEMSRLLLETELGPEQLTYAEVLSGSSQDLLNVVNDLLDFTRIESGTLELRELDFDLRVTVDTVATALGGWAAEQQRPLQISVDPSVPTGLTGDPARVRQVLLTLGRSMLVPDSDAPLVLSVRVAQETARGVELAIQLRTKLAADGIEEAAMLRRAFNQGNPEATQKLGGKGMSLRLSRQMVSLLSGRILESEGATDELQFAVQIPFLKQHEEVAAPPVETPEVVAASEPGDPLAGRRALIADPFGRCGGTIVPMLESWSCEAVRVRSGEEVLTQIEEAKSAGSPFAFALLDAVLPDMSLDQVVERLRTETDQTRLLMTTSMGQPGDAEWASRLGFEAYLPMPIAEADLKDALLEIVRRDAAGAGGPESLITRHALAERRMRLRASSGEEAAASAAAAPPSEEAAVLSGEEPIAPGFQNWESEGPPRHTEMPRDEYENFFGDEEQKAA